VGLEDSPYEKRIKYRGGNGKVTKKSKLYGK
jgi:hypothetical protein